MLLVGWTITCILSLSLDGTEHRGVGTLLGTGDVATIPPSGHLGSKILPFLSSYIELCSPHNLVQKHSKLWLGDAASLLAYQQPGHLRQAALYPAGCIGSRLVHWYLKSLPHLWQVRTSGQKPKGQRSEIGDQKSEKAEKRSLTEVTEKKLSSLYHFVPILYSLALPLPAQLNLFCTCLTGVPGP